MAQHACEGVFLQICNMAQRACEGVFLQICNMAQTVRGEFIFANS